MRACFMIALLIGLLIPGAALRYADPPLERGQPVQVAATTAPLPTTTVVVASRDLSPRELLHPEALQEVAWPVEALPAGAFTTIGDLLGDGSATRRARHEILPGEPVLRSKISGFRGRDIPRRTGQPRQRGPSVRVSASPGIAGALLPGDACRLAIALPLRSRCRRRTAVATSSRQRRSGPSSRRMACSNAHCAGDPAGPPSPDRPLTPRHD